MSEFTLIHRHFTRPAPNAVLGVGDDAALLQVSAGQVLAVSSDMLVSGTHFFADADPYLLGHKTLAVNLSDMAAMGAMPRWATLALSLPQVDEIWLTQFSAGFFALADAHGVTLVGGDTTRGALNLCVTIMGEVPQGRALRRDGAKLGDDIWVSGTLGDAALGLAHLQGKIDLPEDARIHCLAALHQPTPRVALGLALRGVASAAIDVSDGLLADLGHILAASGVGAEVEFVRLPVAAVLGGRVKSETPPNLPLHFKQRAQRLCLVGKPLAGLSGEETTAPSLIREGWGGFRVSLLQHCLLAGGDDYELCFTAAPAQRVAITTLSAELNLPLTRIGRVLAGCGCVVKDADGAVMDIQRGGYEHFA